MGFPQRCEPGGQSPLPAIDAMPSLLPTLANLRTCPLPAEAYADLHRSPHVKSGVITRTFVAGSQRCRAERVRTDHMAGNNRPSDYLLTKHDFDELTNFLRSGQDSAPTAHHAQIKNGTFKKQKTRCKDCEGSGRTSKPSSQKKNILSLSCEHWHDYSRVSWLSVSVAVVSN